MSDLAGPIIEWLNANPQLAGLVTFAISAAESIAIIGTIVPGSIMMSAVGALVGTGVIPFGTTIIWAILGAIAGDGVSYWLGYHFKDHIYELWPFKKHPQILQSGEVFFRKHGSMSVFIGRFVGPVRALVPMVAGMFGMRPIIFIIANVMSAIAWAPMYMLPGFILGAASQELPSELAGHLILTILLWLLFVGLCFWLFRKSIKAIRTKVNHFLDWLWDLLEKSHYFHIVITALKHYDPRKTHGQLRIALYFIIVVLLLSYLTLAIISEGSPHILINKIVFYYFRSVRSFQYDDFFLMVSFLGDKWVLLPVLAALFGWLLIKKHWRTALHVFVFTCFLVIAVNYLKLSVHSARPWGILNNRQGFSFPSGNAVLSMAVYLGFVYFISHIAKFRRTSLLFFFTFALIFSIAIARLYFGVHWFTDILGGWLLAGAILILAIISYNRKPRETIEPKGLVLTLITTLIISYSLNFYFAFDKTKLNYTELPWPTYQVQLDDWWNQEGHHLPLYRVNRFGIQTKIFNLQWVGDLPHITETLLANGWQIPPKLDWISVLYRISSVESTAHLPLVQPLYLDKPPVLVFTKSLTDKKLLILRLWDSYTHIQNSKDPLWVGSVEIAPSTYSWLQVSKHYPEAGLIPQWIFSTEPTKYDLKIVITRVKINHHHSKDLPIILIKSKPVKNSGKPKHKSL